jgi:arylsulfatase A-like enzyme
MAGLSRRRFLRAIGVGAAAMAMPRLALSAETTPAAAQRPNILLINVDDLGWSDVACFGSKFYETPNIDRLCAQGMKFTNAYASAAICSPTRAAMLTGRYPARLGLTDWIRFLNGAADEAVKAGKNPTEYVAEPGRKLACPPNPYWMELDEVTLAEVLKTEGYATAHIGKWHLGPKGHHPDDQGFAVNLGGCDYGDPPSYFDPWNAPPGKDNGEDTRKGIPTLRPRKEGEYLTDREADEADAFIRANRDKPFFLNLWHYAVHMPIEGKPEVVAKYEAKEKTTWQKGAKYAAMIESVDDSVGKVMKTLDELKLSGRTIVIFTSDNGGMGKNLPLRANKGTAYEGGIRVPMIIRFDGVVKPGSVCDTPTSSIDLMPTLCEVAGAKLPAGRAIDGESLMPLARQSGSLKRDTLYWHYPHYRNKQAPYSIIRQGDWKLIKSYEGKEFQLFNLKSDMAETTDLADKEPARVKAMDALLSNWLKDVGAKLPRPA